MRIPDPPPEKPEILGPGAELPGPPTFTPPAAPEIVRVYELARRLGCSASALRQAVDDGKIPCAKIGKALLFDVPTVERAIRELAQAHRPTDIRKARRPAGGASSSS